MKKRILCAIVSAIMAVGMMTGCGSKETTSNKTVENVSDKSDKTEEKYAERMEAYLDYFQSEEKDYDGVVGAAITLDSDSLPLLWLTYAESKGRVNRIQLCSYENDKVNILAEKKIEGASGCNLYLGVGTAGIQVYYHDEETDGDDATVLIYDSEEQDFKFYDTDYFEDKGYFDSSSYKNEDDIENNYKAMMKDLEAYRIYNNNQLIFWTLRAQGKTAYLGIMDRNEIYIDYLKAIGALDDSIERDDISGIVTGVKLTDKYKDNKFVNDILDEHFSKDESGNYSLDLTIHLPDGTETSAEGMVKYYGITEDEVANKEISTGHYNYNESFLIDKNAEAFLRNLIKHPAYSAFEIKILNEKENRTEEDFKSVYGDIVEVKELLKDAADNKDNSVDSTESTESIKREDSTEISKETNNNMPAWKQAYIDYINGLDEQIDAYRLVDINSDNIPEIYYQYNTKTRAKLMYLNHADEVKTLDAIHASSNFGYNSRGIVDSFTRTGVTTELMYKYDSSKDEYIQIFNGSSTDGIGNNGVKQYEVNGVEVPIDEYITAFNQADLNSEFNNFNEESMLTSGDIVSAIQNY